MNYRLDCISHNSTRMPPSRGPRLDQMMLSAQTKDRRKQLLADSRRALGELMTPSRLVQQSGHKLFTVLTVGKGSVDVLQHLVP